MLYNNGLTLFRFFVRSSLELEAIIKENAVFNCLDPSILAASLIPMAGARSKLGKVRDATARILEVGRCGLQLWRHGTRPSTNAET